MFCLKLFLFSFQLIFVNCQSCDDNGACESTDSEETFEILRSRYLNDLQVKSFDTPEELLLLYEEYHRKVFKLAPKQGEFVWFRVPGQGWANRLRTFASAYLMAVLSGRIFIVEWKHPQPLENFVKQIFPWDYTTLGLNKQNDYRSDSKFIVSKGPYEGGGKKVDWWQKLESSNITTAFNEKILILSGYSAFSSAFLENKLYAKQMALFDSQCPLRDIVPYLIQPSNKVEQEMKPLLDKISNKEVIGLQMRLGTKENYFMPGPLNKLDPELKKIYEGPEAYTLWFKCALVAIKEDPNVLIYLATDNPEVLSHARVVFGENLVYYEGPIEHSGGIQPEKTDLGQIKVMVDWFMLGEVTVLYRTFWSTFGYTSTLRTSPTTVTIPMQYSETCELPNFNMMEYTNHC